MKRTRWYDGEQKPVYVGVYERKFGKASSYFPHTTFFSRWDGKYWAQSGVTVEGADARRNFSHLQHLPWRGFTK